MIFQKHSAAAHLLITITTLAAINFMKILGMNLSIPKSNLMTAAGVFNGVLDPPVRKKEKGVMYDTFHSENFRFNFFEGESFSK